MMYFSPALPLLILSLVSGALFCPQVSAGIVIGGTRFVYGEKQHSLNVSIRNKSDNVFLIQARTETGGDWGGSKVPINKESPFIVTPPLFALKPDGENTMRVIKTSGELPKTKESLFTLDIASIPSGKVEPNSVQIAVRTKLKLFYRPANLKGNPQFAYTQLKWHREGDELFIKNESPYYVTLFQLSVNGVPIENAGMVPPQDTRIVNWCSGRDACQLRWQTINDYGRIMPAVSLTVVGPNPVSVSSADKK